MPRALLAPCSIYYQWQLPRRQWMTTHRSDLVLMLQRVLHYSEHAVHTTLQVRTNLAISLYVLEACSYLFAVVPQRRCLGRPLWHTDLATSYLSGLAGLVKAVDQEGSERSAEEKCAMHQLAFFAILNYLIFYYFHSKSYIKTFLGRGTANSTLSLLHILYEKKPMIETAITVPETAPTAIPVTFPTVKKRMSWSRSFVWKPVDQPHTVSQSQSLLKELEGLA